jgi:outer membrane protein, heavy metal efflux system
MHPFHYPVVLAFVLAVYPLRAEPTVIVSLESVGQRVRAENPDLAAARLRIDEALGRVSQSGRLANPELETSFEHNPRFREGRLQVEFSQRFPLTNRLQQEKEISIGALKSSEAEVREIERQLIAQARETVVKLLAARQHRALLREQAAASGELADSLSDAASKGEGSALDAGQARLESASLTIETRQLAATEAELAGTLKALLGMRPGEALDISGKLPEPEIPAAGVTPSRRPDLQAAKLAAITAAQAVGLEQARRYEDVEAGVFAAAERSEDVPAGYDNEAILGLRFKIPLPLWNKNEGAIQQAEATRMRKEMEVAALTRNIRLEADATRAEMAEWAALVREISSHLLPLADEHSALAEASYRAGQGDIQTVLRSRGKRLQLASSRLDALREFHLARVRHEAATAKH